MADFSVARFVIGFFELICGLVLLVCIGGAIWAFSQEQWEAFAALLGGLVGSLVLMAICQLVKAQIVTADACQRMLAIMQKQSTGSP